MHAGYFNARDVVLAAARRGLYTHNVFRMLGLGSDASDSAVRRRLEQLRASEELGLPAEESVSFYRIEEVGVSELETESVRLNRPETRFVEELFWPIGEFLDNFGAASTPDIAVGKLLAARGRATSAELHWIAILLQTISLEKKPDAAIGDAAMRAWQVVIDDDIQWQRFEERFMELGGPASQVSFVERVRDHLAEAILFPHAEQAVGETLEANLHRSIIARSGFRSFQIDSALRMAATPVIQQLRRLADEIVSMEANPQLRGSSREVKKVVSGTIALLNRLPKGDDFEAFYRKQAETLTGPLHSLVVEFTNATHDWNSAAELYRQVISIAESPSLIGTAQKNLALVLAKTTPATSIEPICHFCGARSTPGLDYTVTLLNPSTTEKRVVRIARCGKCFSHQSMLESGPSRADEIPIFRRLLRGVLLIDAIAIALWLGMPRVASDIALMVEETAGAVTILFFGWAARLPSRTRRRDRQTLAERVGQFGELKTLVSDGWKVES